MTQKTLIGAFVLAAFATVHAQQSDTAKPTSQGASPTQGQGKSAGQSGSTQSKSGALSQQDRTFIMTAAENDQKEIAVSQMAQQKAQSDQVKQLAARIEKDHRQSSQELQTIAQSKGVTLAADKSDAAHKGHMAKFDKLEGAGFDRAYATMMVQDHKQAIALFEKASKSQDPQVSAFAEKTLPVLREHLKMSQQAQGGDAKATSGAQGGQSGTPGQKPGAGK